LTLQFTNVPAFLATSGRAHVLIERMPSTNALVSAPTVVSNTQVTLDGTTLTTSISWSNALDAYAVTLTRRPWADRQAIARCPPRPTGVAQRAAGEPLPREYTVSRE